MQAVQAGNWPEAQRLLQQLEARQPGYRDVRQQLAQVQARLQGPPGPASPQGQLEQLYSQAMQAIQAGQWLEAQRFLRQLEREQPGYRDAAQQLAFVNGKVIQVTSDLQSQRTAQNSPPAKKSVLPGLLGIGILGGIGLIALIGFFLVIAVMSAGNNSNMATDYQGDNSITYDNPTPAPIVVIPPTSIPLPTATEIPVQPYFAGIQDEAQIEWAVNDVDYVARIRLDGETGYITVAYYSPTTGELMTIYEDLTLYYYEGDWFYVGSDPMDANTGLLTDGYAADVFKLEQVSDSTWIIDAICDVELQCSTDITITALQ
jgi:hypothetical protein